MAKKVTEGEEQKDFELDVADPQDLRPTELPLVVKPADGGEWQNAEQAEYATYLNAYAYSNPTKWQVKKDVLLKRLLEIGKDGSSLAFYRGGTSPVAFKNKLIDA